MNQRGMTIITIMLWTPITSCKTVLLQKLEVFQTWAISLRIYLAMAQR